MQEPSNPLQSLSVLDQDSVSVPLASLWQERNALLVFVRHFGCLFCQEQVRALAEIAPQLEQANTDLAVIGNGTATFIAGFRQRSGFGGQIFTDPTRASYAALALRRDLRSSLNLKTISRAIAAFGSGSRQTSVQGDPWQQGGVVLVNTGGQIVYRYASSFAGDHPPNDELVSRAQRAFLDAGARTTA
jgi:peroxiredoxin